MDKIISLRIYFKKNDGFKIYIYILRILFLIVKEIDEIFKDIKGLNNFLFLLLFDKMKDRKEREIFLNFLDFKRFL